MVVFYFHLTLVTILVVSISHLTFAPITSVEMCKRVLKENGFDNENGAGYKNFQNFFLNSSITKVEDQFSDLRAPTDETVLAKNFRRFTRTLIMRLHEVLFDNNKIILTGVYDDIKFCNNKAKLMVNNLPRDIIQYDEYVLEKKCQVYIFHLHIYNYPNSDSVSDAFKTGYDTWSTTMFTFNAMFGYEEPDDPPAPSEKEKVLFFKSFILGFYNQFRDLVNDLNELKGDFEDNNRFCQNQGSIIVAEYNIPLED